MWVESEIGVGSRFFFTTVLGIATAVKATPVAPLPEIESAKPLQILLVDDNLINQKVAKRMLESYGNHVSVAGNGLQALAALERLEWKVDAIFMDVQMPEMDGIAATREIRRLESINGKRIPIFALTAHAQKSDEEACLAAGMDAHLTKPMQADTLQRALRDVRQGNFGLAGQQLSGK
jgi:CheY-like chemotaxis protein